MTNLIREWVRVKRENVFQSMMKNSAWAAIGQIVLAGTSFLETIILARYLALTDFGVLVTVTAAAELIYGLLDFRSGEAVIKFIPEIRSLKGNRGACAFLKIILLLDAVVAVCGLGITVILGAVILKWSGLQEAYFASLLIISFGLAVRCTVRSCGSYFRICGRFNQATIIGSSVMLCRLALMVIAAKLSPTVSGFSWASAWANILFTIAVGTAFLVIGRDDGLRWVRSPIRLIDNMWRPLAGFLVSTNIAGTLKVLSTKLDTLLIAGLTSPEMVAIYRVAARISGSVIVLSDPLLVAIYPELSHLQASGRMGQLRRLILPLSLGLGACSALLVSGFVIGGRWILGAVAGPQYGSAYPVVLIMFIGSVVSMTFFWVRPLLLLRGHAHTLVWIYAVGLFVQLGALYLLVPFMGAAGGGLALTLSCSVNVVLSLWVTAKSARMNTARNVISPLTRYVED